MHHANPVHGSTERHSGLAGVADMRASASSVLRLTPEASRPLLAGAAVWAAVIWLAGEMGFMAGTMGLGAQPRFRE